MTRSPEFISRAVARAVARTVVALLALAVLLTGCELSADSWQIDDLPNPGRGWTTFHSLNSDSRNNRYPESTVAYYRFSWRELEPEQGQIDFDMIDVLLSRAEADGQTLAFRIMPDCSGCQGNNLGVPEWLIDLGIGGVWFQRDAFMPDFDDPIYLQNAERVIRALGDRYNGDPRVDHVDIGFVGHWGEWHVSDAVDDGAAMPSLDNQKKYIDWHLESFPDTPVLMLLGDTSDTAAQALAYAIDGGAGWRADCWGDYRRGWNHMEDLYPGRLAAASAGDAWKTAPVALETCGVPSTWLWLFPGRVDDILQFAIDNHVSLLNGKSDSIPVVWRDRFAEFTSHIGYRLELELGEVPGAIAPGASAVLNTTWTNHGNAPVYRPYELKVRLTSQNTPSLVYTYVGVADVRSWIPGTFQAPIVIDPPVDAVAGAYDVEIGLVDPEKGEAAIQFLFEGGARRWAYAGGITLE